MHQTGILMHMRTTVILDDTLLERALQLSGLSEKTAVLHEGLRALISRESARRLGALGGSQPRIQGIRRRRTQSR
jgi:Arc/MetJ family transcription regulator